jgi:hypothetical protein
MRHHNFIPPDGRSTLEQIQGKKQMKSKPATQHYPSQIIKSLRRQVSSRIGVSKEVVRARSFDRSTIAGVGSRWIEVKAEERNYL